MQTIYISDDGNQFISAESCLAHEAKVKEETKMNAAILELTCLLLDLNDALEVGNRFLSNNRHAASTLAISLLARKDQLVSFFI